MDSACSTYGHVTLSRVKSQSYVIDMTCMIKSTAFNGCQWRGSDSSGLIKERLEADIDEFWTNLVTQFSEVDSTTIYRGRRSKRQLGLIIGAGGLITGAIATGLSWYSNKKLQTTVNRMKGEFRDFVSEVHTFEMNVLETERNLLKLVDRLDNKVEQVYKKSMCEIGLLQLGLLQAQEVNRFKEKIREVVRPLDLGKTTGHFTPRLLNVSLVRKLVQQHPRLNNSEYAIRPSLVYATSLIKLAELTSTKDQDSIAVHLVLSIPVLKNETIFNYYSVAQTGFSGNGSCWEFDLPKFVFLREADSGKTYYNLDKIPCDSSNDLFKFCSVSSVPASETKRSFLKVGCLTGNLEECSLTKVKCREKSIYTIHGLLTRADSDLQGVYRTVTQGSKVEVWKPQEGSRNTKYWSWKIFESVDLSEGIAIASDYTEDIAVCNVTNQERWWSLIKSSHERLLKMNLTEVEGRINKTLEDIDLRRDWFSEDNATDFTIEITVATISGIVITLVMTFLARRFYVRCIKSSTTSSGRVQMKPLLEKEKTNGEPASEDEEITAKGPEIASAPEMQTEEPSNEVLTTITTTPPPYEESKDEDIIEEGEPIKRSTRTQGAYLRPLSK